MLKFTFVLSLLFASSTFAMSTSTTFIPRESRTYLPKESSFNKANYRSQFELSIIQREVDLDTAGVPGIEIQDNPGIRLGGNLNFNLGSGFSTSTGLSLSRTTSDISLGFSGNDSELGSYTLQANTELTYLTLGIEQRLNYAFSYNKTKYRPFIALAIEKGDVAADSEAIISSSKEGNFAIPSTDSKVDITITSIAIGTQVEISPKAHLEFKATINSELEDGDDEKLDSQDITLGLAFDI